MFRSDRYREKKGEDVGKSELKKEEVKKGELASLRGIIKGVSQTLELVEGLGAIRKTRMKVELTLPCYFKDLRPGVEKSLYPIKGRTLKSLEGKTAEFQVRVNVFEPLGKAFLSIEDFLVLTTEEEEEGEKSEG